MFGFGTFAVAAIAYVFYKIGENDYTSKGWLLAFLSIIFSVCGAATGLGFIGVCGANVALNLICLVYNFLSKRPPG
jgi:hypothetical protein